MKKSIEIIGLPVFSIAQGREIGKVKDFVIDSQNGAVVALVIDDGKWYLGAKLLPMSAITAIGEFAVTVDSVENIREVKDMQNIEGLLDANIKVIGTNVLTNTGRICGKVTEIIIDDNGKICSCEVEENAGEISEISSQRILTYGKEVMIVADPEAKKSLGVKPLTLENKVENSIPVTQPEPTHTVPTIEKKAIPVEQAETVDESAKKFDDRHRKYLLGKKASRKIETENGMVIVEQGGEITEEVLQKAKLAGKFVELSMNIQ